MEQTDVKRSRKNYYEENPDKFKQISKRYYEERGGKQKKQEYYEANKDAIIQRSKQRYLANRENILEAKRLKLIEKKLSQVVLEQNGENPSNDGVITTQPTK